MSPREEVTRIVGAMAADVLERLCCAREDLQAARELIVDQLAREKPVGLATSRSGLDQVAQIARAAIRDSEILYKRDALRLR